MNADQTNASAAPQSAFSQLTTDYQQLSGRLAKETGLPYQNLINLYLRECVHEGKKPALSWGS